MRLERGIGEEMAKTEGYNEYACDVQSCTQHDFAKPNTDKADSYVTRHRITDEGVDREIMLCAEHNTTYAKLVGTCEQAYIKFEKDGEYALATKEEVDALTEQLEEAQAAYEAMKKDRNSWMKKYSDLEAEYEEYKRTHPDTEGGEE